MANQRPHGQGEREAATQLVRFFQGGGAVLADFLIFKKEARISLFFFFFGRERVRKSVSGGGTERKADRESEAGSRLWAVSTESNVGLELTSRKIVT